MHPFKLLIASSIWITSILSLPFPLNDPYAVDLLGQHPEQEEQRRNREHDLALGLSGGFAISTFASALRNHRSRSDTDQKMRGLKKKYVELRNRMPLDQTEVYETYWDGMDEFFADEKLVRCMRYNLSVEDDVREIP